ncbi:MAG: hypothetical protein CMI53_01605 [Parcubacteria group bacterium]|nr:hypothetical protein [Parcubacteria group bacterium]
MYENIKTGDNNLKGEIGEVIANHFLKKPISTKRFWSSILNNFNLESEQSLFLKENWKSFDLIDLESLTIYEVKTRNFFHGKLKGVKNKIVITPNFSKLCKTARTLGFSIKIIEITLFSDWKYTWAVKDFNHDDFWVHRPRPSGWERQSRKK